MTNKGRTSSEINLFHIQRTLKKLKKGTMTVQGCGLNKRFDKLKVESLPWYEDLYPKYIQIVKELNE
jgi:hypothetical protein|tara:strand:+ start:2971 stop:3171 length:201 start_codon:yes stop_codon:yes gene_type:complete